MASIAFSFEKLTNVSLIVIAFAILCLILICIFICIITERICPLCCFHCCPSQCHDTCSSKIHRLSDTYYVSRKQITLRIKKSGNLNLPAFTIYSASVTSATTPDIPVHSELTSEVFNVNRFNSNTSNNSNVNSTASHSRTDTITNTNTATTTTTTNTTNVLISNTQIVSHIELSVTKDMSVTATNNNSNIVNIAQQKPVLKQRQSYRSIAGIPINADQLGIDEQEDDGDTVILPTMSDYGKLQSLRNTPSMNSPSMLQTQHIEDNSINYSPRSPRSRDDVVTPPNTNTLQQQHQQHQSAMYELEQVDSMLTSQENTSSFANCIICLCIPCCYWDSNILKEYKRKRKRELNNGTISRSFKQRIIENISYFGLSMNVILFCQCVSIFMLYHFAGFEDDLFINLYYIFHNIWLILCNIALTGILLNILHIVRSTDEDANDITNDKRLNSILISFCLVFIICTITFHILCIFLNTIYWDIVGGIIRNLLICILCIILAKSTFSLKRSVVLTFSRVSNSISNEHQINEHKQIVKVLMVLFISSIILALLVTAAAVQYAQDLFTNTSVKQSISEQDMPGMNVTDIAWLFIKLMSSLIILYYAVINVKQRRKVMISIVNEQIAILKDRHRSKRKRSFASNRLHSMNSGF